MGPEPNGPPKCKLRDRNLRYSGFFFGGPVRNVGPTGTEISGGKEVPNIFSEMMGVKDADESHGRIRKEKHKTKKQNQVKQVTRN